MSAAAGEAPTFALVTVAFNSDPELRRMFASLAGAGLAPAVAVIADNAATPGTALLAAELGARYLALPLNPGYGAAVNAAAAEVEPTVEWLLVANPDVEFAPGSIAALVEAGRGDERIGSVGPLIRGADGTIYPSARRVPSIRTGVGHALFARVWPSNPWTRRYHDGLGSAGAGRRGAGWLSGSCLLVRRSAFDEVAGFDPEYFMYFEDVDLGHRLGRSGYTNLYEPDAEIVHTGGHSTGDSPAMIRAHHRSAERFIEKKYRGWLFWPLRIALKLGLRLRSRLVR